ncbi:hypothetical protein AMECASPLE_023132 [Ameca splendens]|uniref:Uncharacterized protein n=1 Tax=Ameca splendens TaxID=208324 RepID=A0ABV0YRB5_9TELE
MTVAYLLNHTKVCTNNLQTLHMHSNPSKSSPLHPLGRVRAHIQSFTALLMNQSAGSVLFISARSNRSGSFSLSCQSSREAQRLRRGRGFKTSRQFNDPLSFCLPCGNVEFCSYIAVCMQELKLKENDRIKKD